MPKLCTIDMETYYDREFSLSKITTEAYVRSPLFETIGCSFKFDGAPTYWVKGPDVAAHLAAQDWSDTLIICQNTAFDGAILKWLYGVDPLAWIDIMGMSRALFPHAKSHSLKAQAERMGVGVKGDEVINALGKRYKDFSPEELARYGDYCINDVELTHDLFHKYMAMGFPKQELKLIDLTLRMFIDPVLELDKGLLSSHLANVKERKAALMDKVRDMMLEGADPDQTQVIFSEGAEGIKKLMMSNEKFAGLLRAYGAEPPQKVSPTTGKLTWAFAKTDEGFKALEEHESPDVQALVACRLGTKTTIEETRTQSLIYAAERGPLAVPLRYYGAHTGRWSADSGGAKGGLNMQNLPRTSPIKAAIKAPEGFVLCGADLSNIELRLGLYLAGQNDKVESIRNNRDLYKEFASVVYHVPYDAVTKPQRQAAKVACLSLIYGTGAAKLKDALRIMGGVYMPLEEVKPLVQIYRDTHKQVAAAWKTGEQALQAIANDQHTSMYVNGLCPVEGRKGIKLPSGLYIQYPNLRRIASEKGSEWVFDSKFGIERVYGAKVFQGCTQAVARCVIGTGMLRIAKKYVNRLAIHDSAYWLAPIAEAEQALEYGIKCLTDPVSYVPGLPLAAEGAYGASLKDC